MRERLGRIPTRIRQSTRGKQIVWLHAVSVGEVLAASRLIEELEQALNRRHPAMPWLVVVSTTTRTGQHLARERFGAERVFWFPLDFAWAVRAWMRALHPHMVVLVESELWPRLLAECKRNGIPVAVVNARMSDRSYRRARRLRRPWSRVLAKVSMFFAQSNETAERLADLGVSLDRIRVTGNMKYDLEPRPSPVMEALRLVVGRRPLVVAGSLLEPEEQLLLDFWPEIAGSAQGAVLLLAPRHPERFEAIAEKISARFPLIRASSLLTKALAHEDHRSGRLHPLSVILLDTVGDLAAVYGLADVAFVGGSLTRKGGHNPLEPARLGVPVMMGPSFENFREIVAEMQAAGGIEIVYDGAELARALSRLLKDRVAAYALGQRGQRVFENQSGATARTVGPLLELLASSAPSTQVRS